MTLSRRQIVAVDVLADGPCPVSYRTDPSSRTVAHQTIRVLAREGLAERDDDMAWLTAAGERLAADPPPLPPVTREHGTNACYTLDQCRCGPCEDAHLQYERQRRRDIAEGSSRTVDAEPVREHVRSLMADSRRGATNGVGLKQIARVSGVAHGALWKLMYGDPGRDGPSRTVRSSTAEALLAVTHADRADGSTVPAGSTVARIDELREAGATWVELAEETGMSHAGIWCLGNGRNTSCTVGAARAVHALHSRWQEGDWTPRGRRSRWDDHG